MDELIFLLPIQLFITLYLTFMLFSQLRYHFPEFLSSLTPHTCFPIPPSRFFLGNFNNVPPLKKRRLSIIKSWHLHHQRLCIVHDKTFILKKNLYIHDFLSVQSTSSCIISCSHYHSTVISPLSLNFIMTKLRNSCYMNILIYRRVLLKLFIAYKYITVL